LDCWDFFRFFFWKTW